jgi:hypothetical protein
VFLAVLPVLWARGTAACAHTLSGLIENLAGHPAGRGILHVNQHLAGGRQPIEWRREINLLNRGVSDRRASRESAVG